MSIQNRRRTWGGEARPVALGTGFVALDLIVPPDESLPEACLAAGGTCGNVLAILAFLGWDSQLATRLGSDSASNRLRDALIAAGVGLCLEAHDARARSPIVLQTFHDNGRGQRHHRFATRCPLCGTWWPSYRPITRDVAADVLMTTQFLALAKMPTRVFFFDRVSPASLMLATELRQQGTLIVFEPGALTPPRLLQEAFRQAHIVKYARDRLPKFQSGLEGARRYCSHWLMEIETQGADGLRFRLPNAGHSRWCHLPSVRPITFADGAGAGDWCSGVLIDGVGRGGYANASRLDPDEVTEHLMRAQAYAALSCGFIGARGLMTQLGLSEAEQRARALLAPAGQGRSSEQAMTCREPEWTLPCCGAVGGGAKVRRL